MTSENKLSSLFVRAQSRSVELDGQTVWSMYTIPAVSPGARLMVRFERANAERPQALRLAIGRSAGGRLEVDGVGGDDLVLWTDTCPDLVPVDVCTASPTDIDVWNMYQTERGEDAWGGNAGMRVDRRGDILWVQCSDAYGDATFDDLVVSIEQHGD